MLTRTNSRLSKVALLFPASLISIMSARVGHDTTSFVEVRLTTGRERRLMRNYYKGKSQ